MRPTQVMLEMDDQRYKSAVSSIVEQTAMSAPSRADIISTVQGGLLSRELKAAVETANEVGASVYLVDRPYRITQNRLAEKVLNPYVFANLLTYGKLSLMASDPSTSSVVQVENFLKKEAMPIYKVLVEERAQYMAQLIHEQARDNETIVIVCSKLHVPIIQSILSSSDIDEVLSKSVNMNELSRKGLPLWPVLVGAYFVLPVGLVLYFWLVVVSTAMGAAKSFIV